MQMLRFRGGSAASSSSSSRKDRGASPRSDPLNPSPSPSLVTSSSSMPSVTPGYVGPARPLRLVYCDEKGKFRMDPEAVATLQLVKGPIGVVSVCGRARQGKSFILNQLLGRSSGFQVASTHRPCTKGLWMWSAPIKRTALDGTEYNLLLLDSEGIDAYDQTGTYSTQIFSLAVLLSSMFIYNQMGGIDEAALDRLSLVTEMTKHIRVRATGGRSATSELWQFSPVFVWLLRDFYLDLVEDNRKISPRDYLELALRPMQGGGKDLSARNEIRESIRSLFPDRECFTLVRPLNDENDLQRLDQIPLNRLRPEFRAGLDALTKFVFERTRPKQVGSTAMTGPILAGITQSFLDAINNGAVPTISSSWQSVEEAECRRSYDSAVEVYMSSFDRTKLVEEDILREAHEDAVQKSLAAFNASAVGSGSARMNYERLLHRFFRKAYEDYKRTAFLEADLQCSNTVHSMEKKLRAACHVPSVKLDSVIQVLESLLSEYESSSHGPSKWKILSSFLRQCLRGPILDLFKKQLDQIESERSALALKCRSNDDKVGLLKKQLEANEKHRAEYLKRYEEAISDKQKFSVEYNSRIAKLQSKCSTLEERCMSIAKDLDLARQESSDWKNKHDQSSLELKAEEDRFKAKLAALESRLSAAEGRLAAAREQAESAQEEASEWKRKYTIAAGEAKTALERAALVQERTNKKAQEREDALRAEFSAQLVEKEEEIKSLNAKFDSTENHTSTLVSQLEAAQKKLESHKLETLAFKDRMKKLNSNLDSMKAKAQSYEREAKILEQERNHLQEKYVAECKKFDDTVERLEVAERDAKRAIELADNARAEVVAAQKEKSEAQRSAMERLTLIERVERQVDSLEQEKVKLMDEVEKLHQSEMDARSKVTVLERRVEEREREIEDLLSRSNEQRSNTVQVLESLLATERAARAEANSRAEALSLQLQATQGRLDALHQELTSVRLTETALDSKLRTASHGKRLRLDNYRGTESVHDMEVDEGLVRGRKRSKSTTSPLKITQAEDGGSVYKGEDYTQSQDHQETGSEDYTKFTILKLKQELTKHGFGGQLVQLRNPNKKEIVALYEKHVLEK
ncbi:guanylate-binding protein 4-like isoform X1 [Phoenix dactylifera]|uniref:Guanylate-binding protein 4-like isoform X1 n=1 Tax=Phoenix dactylifera TaxID=42345 RepID=A0A8B7BHY3_PHODC|nr:guanylate-binding protein 4-like isoform X1 [Phoenix dactylifera]